MFTRDSKPSRIDTLIGKSRAACTGTWTSRAACTSTGTSPAAVRSDDARDSSLSVSETGSIEGPVQVPNVMLNGTVRGDIQARERVVLGATARVEGNVHYGVIEMTLGAQISREAGASGARRARCGPPGGPGMSAAGVPVKCGFDLAGGPS